MNSSRAPYDWGAFGAFIGADGTPVDGAPLGAVLSGQAAAAPVRPALTYEGITLTRMDLDCAANRRARQLQQVGVGADDVVVIMGKPTPAYYATAFACWKIGAIPCHISHQLTTREMGDLLRLAAPKVLLTNVDVAANDVRHLQLEDIATAVESTPLQALASETFRISTSGGSTGRPKLILDVHSARWGPDKLSVHRPPRSTIVNPAPMHHAAPFSQMLTAIAQGGHVIQMSRFDPLAYLELVDRHHATWAYLVPTMMGRIAKLPDDVQARFTLQSLKTLVHMAAPCPHWLKRWWIGRLGACAVWEVYGGSERVGSTMIGGEEWLQHPGSIGRPRAGFEAAILSGAGAPLPPHEIGDICFRNAHGPGTTYKYIGESKRAARGGWETFGDMGWMDDDGYIYLADRRVDMIVSGGANIWPAEIEGYIDSLPGVLSSAVIGLPDDDMGQLVHAIVEHDGSVSIDALEKHLQGGLAKSKWPRSYELTRDTIRNEAGKVRRTELRNARLKL